MTAASSLRTAAAELPTLSIARASSCSVTPKCLVQCLMPSPWSRTILLRSGLATSIIFLVLRFIECAGLPAASGYQKDLARVRPIFLPWSRDMRSARNLYKFLTKVAGRSSSSLIASFISSRLWAPAAIRGTHAQLRVLRLPLPVFAQDFRYRFVKVGRRLSRFE